MIRRFGVKSSPGFTKWSSDILFRFRIFWPSSLVLFFSLRGFFPVLAAFGQQLPLQSLQSLVSPRLLWSLPDIITLLVSGKLQSQDVISVSNSSGSEYHFLLGYKDGLYLKKYILAWEKF